MISSGHGFKIIARNYKDSSNGHFFAFRDFYALYLSLVLLQNDVNSSPLQWYEKAALADGLIIILRLWLLTDDFISAISKATKSGKIESV